MPENSKTIVPSDADLIRCALEAREHAYAPYSNYAVGAAVRTADGSVFGGANVENATFGLSICAERSAVCTAVGAGQQEIVAVAVATKSSPPAAPCGPCRQTLAEFARDLPIILVNDQGERSDVRLSDLLPHAFHGDELK